MKILLASLIIIISLFAISCNEENCNCNNNETHFPDLLLEVESNIYADLNTINGILSLGAYRIATSDLSEESIRKELSNQVSAKVLITESSFIDADGILKYIEPEEYQEYEGSDISTQTHFIKLHETLQPVLSDLFIAVQGFYAFDIAYPIVKDNKFLGAVNFLLKPSDYLGSIIIPMLQGRKEEIWIMSLDAIVVYDQDEAEIGKNVITDPGYQQFTSLIEAAHKIADNLEGETEYSYYQTATEQTITKKTYWRTIEYYGTQWRLVIAIPKD